MSTVVETSVMLSSITGALIVSFITGLFIDLTVVPISVAQDEEIDIDVAKYISADSKDSSYTDNLTVSEEERRRYLEELQSQTTRNMILTLVYLILIAVVGTVGNTIVILVYYKRFQWTATGFLIVTIAVLDVAANTIAIPGEVYHILHMWDFNNRTLCRARRFISAFTTLSSAIVLVAVAVTRYRKVCQPYYWQVTQRKAKIISFTICSLGALFATPYAIVHGITIKKTGRRNIVGYECSTDEAYIKTMYPLFIYIFYLILFLVCAVSITVLYILIGVQAWKHRQMHGGSPCTSVAVTQPVTSAQISTYIIDQSIDQNESNCKCGCAYNKNIDMLITDLTSIQGSSHVDIIKWKQFLAGNKLSESPVEYYVRVFTDRIEVRTRMVQEFFVKLLKAIPATVNVPSHDGEHNTDKGNKIQPDNGPGKDTSTGEKRMIRSTIYKEKIREVKSSLGNVDSNCELTEMCTNQFRNRVNKLDAAGTNIETTATVNILYSKEGSEKSASIYDKYVLNLYKVVNIDRQHPRSETVATEILSESGNWPMFKWLDVIYSTDNEHATFDSHSVKRETNPSFRLALNKNLLQQSEWWRASVVNAIRKRGVAQCKSCGGIQDQGTSIDNAHDEFTCGEPSIDEGSNYRLERRQSRGLFRQRLAEAARRASLITSSSQPSSVNKRPVSRTTSMLFIISAFFILSYLPHLVLIFIEFVDANAFFGMSMTARKFYNLGMRSIFFNCAVNPIVYSLCDINFRRECFKLFKCT